MTQNKMILEDVKNLLGRIDSLEQRISALENSKETTDADDELFEAAKEWVISSKITSRSGIQRKFRIGYDRADRLITKLAECGIIDKDNEIAN